MKNLLIILFLSISTLLSATEYYVRTDGSDANDGLTNNAGGAWLTLSHACSEVAAGAHTINVGTGTFIESSQCVLAVGVSIVGDGEALSIIQSAVGGSWDTQALISAVSGSITSGNQSIHDIAFDGDALTGFSCIFIGARSDFDIYDCTFTDFNKSAVTFNGQVGEGSAEPSSWCTGNTFYDNTITNCAAWFESGTFYSGSLQIGAQDGMLIHDNNITNNTRGDDLCGYCIKYWNNGWNRGIKIYDNTIIRATAQHDYWYGWNFAIELWYWMGGVEIYGNTIEGSIDTDHNLKGDYDFAFDIHDNTIGYDDLQHSSGGGNLTAGIYFESNTEGPAYVRNNDFKNLEAVFRFAGRDLTIDSVYIYNNVINGIGNTGDDAGCNVLNLSGDGSTISNLFFLNNTIYAGTTDATYGLFFFYDHTTMTINFDDIYIQNNVIQGFDEVPIILTSTAADGVTVENNDFYGNGTNAIELREGAPDNYTYQNNITTIPGFTTPGSDFTLAAGSDNIGAGFNVGLNTDKDGDSYKSPPSIGAYEYDSSVPSPEPPTVTASITNYHSIEATVAGNVTDQGGSAVTARGICYSTSESPTTSDTCVPSGSGTGSFSCTLRLSSNTTYHVRAYATNESGTAYGSDETFTTKVSSAVLRGGKVVIRGTKAIIVN